MTDESLKHLGGISVELESLSVFLSGWNCDAGDVPRKRKGEKDQHRDWPERKCEEKKYV